MIVYSSENDYKSGSSEKIFSISKKDVQGSTSSTSLSSKALPTVSSTHLSPENKQFLKKLGFKLKTC